MRKVLFLIMLLLSLSNCEKDEPKSNKTKPTVTTSEVTDITQTTAICGGEVTEDGGSAVTKQGICWSTNPSPTKADSTTDNSSDDSSSYTSLLTSLTANTTYYVRAYATNSVDTAYGNELTFTTTETPPNPPVADFTSNQTTIIKGTTINFTDTTTNSPTSWSWTFAGGLPSSSTQQNPSITYNTIGTYDVELTATNADGSDTETKTAFITVTSSVTDIDGNTYPTVIIGTQEWMAEDLRVTHYPNGDAIPYISDNTTWADLRNNNFDDAFSLYNNNNTSDYGVLYSFAAAIADNWTKHNNVGQGVCPNGWHLPSNNEWTILIDYLGGTIVAGGKMKETDTSHWNSPNTGATNISGFTALPGGYRLGLNGTFNDVGYRGYWWSTSGYYDSSFIYILSHNLTKADSGIYNKSNGLCVRCLKD